MSDVYMNDFTLEVLDLPDLDQRHAIAKGVESLICEAIDKLNPHPNNVPVTQLHGYFVDVDMNDCEASGFLDSLKTVARLCKDTEPMRATQEEMPGFFFWRIRHGQIETVDADVTPGQSWAAL